MVEGWKNPKSIVWEDGDDRKVLQEFHAITEEYPVFVAQNGDHFDIKVLNGRAWAEQLPPFTNIITLDTLKFSRHNMRLTSHKLDYKAKVMGSSGKNPMSFNDWVAVQEGSKTALKKMVTYCEKDVIELRKVFWSLLPYTNKLPLNMSVLLNNHREGCTHCGSTNIHKNGTRPSSIGLRQRWFCMACSRSWTDTRLKSTTDRIFP
jgi:DNA polymerase elongation subunit (family B)